MKMLKRLLGAVLALATGALNAADLPLEQIKLPPGFSIELWTRVDNPRQMALGRHDRSGGTLFVGSMNAGKVHAIRFDASFKAQAPKPIASDLPRPVGVTYKDGRLYVSAISRILRFDDIEQRQPGRKDVMIRALGNINASHMLDPKLFDFTNITR